MTTKSAIAPADRLAVAAAFALGTLETIQACPADFNREGLADAIRRLKEALPIAANPRQSRDGEEGK